MRFTATLLIATAVGGCGRLGFDALFAAGGSGDAGAPTDTRGDAASTDAGTDAAAGFVTVTTIARSSASPEPTVIVWSNTPAGDVDDVQVTDGSGNASLHVQAGGVVSAAYSPSQEFSLATWNIHTIVGIEPGDVLAFGGTPALCDMTARGTATLSFTPVTAAYYLLSTRCGQTYVPSSPYTWALTASDLDPSDVLVSALDAGGQLLNSASATAVPLPDGATPTLAAGAWMDPVPFMLGVSGFPAGLEIAQIDATPYFGSSGLAAAYADATSTTYNMSTNTAAAVIVAPATTTSFVMVASVADATNSYGVEYEPPAGPAAAIALPALPAQIAMPTFDPVSRAISWQTIAPGGTADRVEVSMGLLTTTGDELDWTVWATPTATGVTLPIVPATVNDYDPTKPQLPRVSLVDYADQADWNASRLAPEWDDLTNIQTPHPHVATIAAATGAL